MKQLILLLSVSILFSIIGKAQYVNIPDPEFKNFLMIHYSTCFNASEQMDTSCSAIVNETMLSPTGDIVNWEGFQYFKNLQTAEFRWNYTTDLPVLPATLKTLYINPMYAGFTSLPALPNGLTKLYCEAVSTLSSLPALPSNLTSLDIINCTGLTSIPALPGSLVHLQVTYAAFLLSFPALPSSLRFCKIINCSQLAVLPTLPASLDTLECPDNYSLTTLPALPASLKRLICSSNHMTVLPTLPAQIQYVDVSYNQITNLPPLSGTSLITLIAYTNMLTTVPTLPASLQKLDVRFNQITALPALPAGLLDLNCRGNQLTSLPVIPASLLYLEYGQNLVPGFPVLPPTLRSLACYGNPVMNITSLPDSLRGLSCDDCQLTSLPTLPQFLGGLSCTANPLTSLPALPDSIINLNIIATNITCLPVLPPGIDDPIYYTHLMISMDNLVTCVPNYPTHDYQLNVRDIATGSTYQYGPGNLYPLCSVINNINHCAAFPVMTGHVYYDNNSNGAYDTGEPYRANVRIDLSDGSHTFTNNNGYYQITVRDTGYYSLSALAPVYFASVPTQYDFHFINFDTLIVKDFGLQGTISRDSLNININPVNAAARPGFSYPYQIAYSNDGTTTLNSNIVFNYDNTRLIYDSCSNVSVINTGTSLTLSEPGFGPGMQKNFIGYFRVNPSAVIGDSLRSGVHIMGGSAAAHDSDVVAIRGSFDPNDKSATPQLTPAQVTNGDYIYYTIRFQNTGTDTAFSIVVTDTLDNKLQASTLQMIATSHPCITTVKGNTISFEFINIMLPDSNVNPLKSHGYISFRIKPVNTLIVNDIVPNKAAIYFDYNSPVITNMATTTIVNPIVVPLKLLSFTISRGVGMYANLYWQTNDEVNVKNYTIEMSTNGRTYTAAGFENAKGYQYNNYTKSIAIPSDAVLYFRLKMTDVDGRYSYSNVAILRNDKVNDAFSFLNNPVKDELSISMLNESLRNTTATIFNAQGIKVRTVLLQHDVEHVNIKSLPAGTYYLVTVKGSGRFVVVR